MCGTPVHGPAVESKIMLVGQAPGAHEGRLGRPFAYTAGKTLFGWIADATGVTQEDFRENVYIASVARCFPGKTASGKGDRVPTPAEILNCREHLSAEVELLKPRLILAVGRLAITEVLGPDQFGKDAGLADVVGRRLRASFHGQKVDVIALPHPSGVSVWPRVEPGKSLLAQALSLIARHPEWQKVFASGGG